MSGREWKPGDVAAVLGADGDTYLGTYHEGDCLLGCAAGSRDAGHWHAGGGAMSAATYDARTLVVIDPEDREQVERLLTSLQDMSFAAHACGAFTCLQHALREFANPKPPRCSAHLNLAGEDFRCVEPPEHGGGHRNPDAEAVWGVGA